MEGNNNENGIELMNDMIEEVLVRMDVPEVTAFKAVGVWYRNLIGSQGFSARYNRHRRPKCNWLVSLVLTADNPRVGFLNWLRPSDGRRMVIDLRPYLGNHMNDSEDEVNLLCASGSVLVFRILSNNDNVYLVTINIFTNQTVFLPVPPFLHFDHHNDLKTLTHPDINLAYELIYTQVVNNDVPCYCQLSSQTQNWELLLDALPDAAGDHRLDPFDPRRMIMAFEAYTLFISFRNHAEQQPIFIRQPTMHLMDLHPFLNLQVVDGWQPNLTHHYGRSGTGLAVSLVRYSHPLLPPNNYIISQLLLYRIDPTFDQYQLLSLLPDGYLRQHNILPMIDVFSLEETDDGMILFSMITGLQDWGLNLLVYTYQNGVWGYSYTPLSEDARRASPPVSTSQLTISPAHLPLPLVV